MHPVQIQAHKACTQCRSKHAKACTHACTLLNLGGKHLVVAGNHELRALLLDSVQGLLHNPAPGRGFVIVSALLAANSMDEQHAHLQGTARPHAGPFQGLKVSCLVGTRDAILCYLLFCMLTV